MSEETKFIIQFVVYPLVTGCVGLIIFIFNLNIKTLRKEIKKEKEDREKEKEDRERYCSKCNDDLNKLIGHNKKNVGKLFDDIEELNKEIGRIDVIEETCKLRHQWDGGERRK